MFSKNFRIYFANFNRKEKITFWIAFAVMCISFLVIIARLNNSFLIKIPEFGGSYTEGIIGNPKFINPIIASSNADEDMTSIIFDGLLKKQNNEFIPDVAENIIVSEDGLNYTLNIRNDVYFHDKTKLGVDDVLFTFKTIQDPRYKSPLFNKWQGIEILKINENTVQFKLKKPFSDFKSQLATGIIPKKYWQNISPEDFYASEQNIDAIGTGPYKIHKVYKNKKGSITEIKLSAFKKHHTKKPYISNFVLIFYGNSKDALADLKSKKLDGLGGINSNDTDLLKKRNIIQIPMTRFYALFLNQNKNPILRDPAIRGIINQSIDREKIVSEVLNNYALTKYSFSDSIKLALDTSSLENKINILEKLGYQLDSNSGIRFKTTKDGTKSTLTVKISTAQNRELIETATRIKNDLLPLGINVEINPYDLGILNQEIIKNRDFEILLFGVDFSKNSDAYALWNSKEKNYPGLNISEYINKATDDLTEDVIEKTNQDEINSAFEKISEITNKDLPVIFLYKPNYIYISNNKDLKNLNSKITYGYDRFQNIENWYVRTDHIWKIFEKNK